MKTLIALAAASVALSACTGYGPRPEPIPTPTDSYRALGTEPGWTVTIAGDRIDYNGDYGETRFTVPRTDPRTTFNGHRYESRTADHSLIVDITHVQCNDGMSDRIFADTVMVEADGKTLRGCGGDILPPVDLAGTNWTITAINGVEIEADAAHFLQFADGRMSGKVGCNSLSAPYSVANRILTTGPISSTKMACPPALMDHERQAFEILGQPLNLRFGNGDTLLLSSSGGTMALKRSI